LLRDPVTRRFISDLPLIIQTLDLHYLVITRQELLDSINALSERYTAAKDFRAYITKQRQIHNTFAQAGQPLSEMDKVKYLSAGVDHDLDARGCIQLYFAAVPDLAGQNFNDLAQRINRMMANKPPSTLNEFIGAASNISMAKLISENEELRAELIEIRRMLKPQQPQKSYCWTHGPCGHTSAQCVQTATGHMREATIQNRMGGRSGKQGKK
jgi:hypothetical protein